MSQRVPRRIRKRNQRARYEARRKVFHDNINITIRLAGTPEHDAWLASMDEPTRFLHEKRTNDMLKMLSSNRGVTVEMPDASSLSDEDRKTRQMPGIKVSLPLPFIMLEPDQEGPDGTTPTDPPETSR